MLDRNILPKLERYPFASITRQEVKALLRVMVAKGGRTTMNRTQEIIRQVFNFAICEDLVRINPATGSSLV